MNRMNTCAGQWVLSALALSCLALFASCKSNEPTLPPEPGAPIYSGLSKVVGTWRFTGLGVPTISPARFDGVDPSKIMSDKMQGITLTVSKDGSATLKDDTHTKSFRLRVAQETEHAIFLSADSPDAIPGRHYKYEKADDRLMMPGEINTPSGSGTIPVYFRRAQ